MTVTPKEWKVTEQLPSTGQIVECYGHHTLCCNEDMDEEPAWHLVKFELRVCEYRMKTEVPEDLLESILEYYKVVERWSCGDEFLDGFVIGVTKWRKIDD